ncbi:acyl-CoA thioesterase [Desulfotomaculum arcticum]|uniref:Acyl-CoA thioesterase n=1 Tax=Desulfotruncus arcticus DSM 17038 TaxID=1121424 RepID=A0A1I2UQA7_9FIRM|nr:hydroxyphenylacetyl-CoA thioesterase PaaI [Desulfotruncus arcticus]SFG79303.1 acyl-CoA thioesterase [Desulfotomaculum arcticum] [Desulfotruncus arcticus DSM 17038]
MTEDGIKLDEELKERIKDDPYPNHLGVKIIELTPGYSKVSLKIKEHMTNIHRITHGGVIFTLADVALGTASNSRGQMAVAVNVNINFIKASKVGDTLIATAREEHLGRRTANYRVTVEDEQGKLIASIQGLVFRETK